jgi:starch phosphorylase
VKVLDVALPQGDTVALGENLDVTATIQLGGIEDEEVVIDLCHGRVEDDSEVMLRRSVTTMVSDGRGSDGVWTFKGTVPCTETGIYGYTIRVLPFHPYLFNPLSMSLVAWG